MTDELPYYGRWHNFDNYSLHSIGVRWWPAPSVHHWPCIPIVFYERDLRQWSDGLRLTWQHPDGRFMQADQHEAETDLGTTLFMRNCFPADEFIRAYAFIHDPACDEVEGHVLWMAEVLEGPYLPVKVSEREAADWLAMAAIAEGVQMKESRPLRELESRTAKIRWAVLHLGPKWEVTK